MCWKSFFDWGFEIPSNCKGCMKSETKRCAICEKKIAQHKDFKVNIIELKRKPPIKKVKIRQFLPYYVLKT